MKPGLLMLPSAVSDSRVHNILPNKIDTDFQFSRASAATRVNHQGLIENVGYFGPELVQNGDFSELGSELVTNGDFSNGSSNWNIQAGTVVFINNTVELQGASIINQLGVTSPSTKTYKVTYTVKSTSGNPVLKLYKGSWFTVNSTIGTHTEYFVPNSGGFFYLRNDSTGNITIDNVSVKQVDPNDRWTLGTSWSFGDGIVETNNTSSFFSQSGLIEASKLYKLTFQARLKSGTNGTINAYIGGSNNQQFTISNTDWQSFTYEDTRGSSIADSIYFNNNGTELELDNISVVEVQGDKPRLDYDPLNPTCPHLLLEPQSTNLLPFSEDFSNGWTNQNTIDTANQATSPDGANNGTKLENTTTSSNYIYRQVTLSTSTDYSISVFVKKGTSNIARLDTWDTTGSTQGSIEINLDTEAISVITGTASFEKYPNDWYKLKVSFTSSGSLGTTYYRIFNNDGVNGSYIYMFGAQLEQQAYVTSYIPTAGATGTRVGEICTNAGNVNTFNSQEGVLYAEINIPENITDNVNIALSDGTNTEYVKFIYLGALSTFRGEIKGGGNAVAVNDTSFVLGSYSKVAVSYKLGQFKLYVNGSQIGSTLTGHTLPTGLDTVSFDRGDAAAFFYGKVKSLATYNRALTDTELYTITSTQYSAYSGMVAALGNYTIPC